MKKFKKLFVLKGSLALLSAIMVSFESPAYGVFDLFSRSKAAPAGGQNPAPIPMAAAPEAVKTDVPVQFKCAVQRRADKQEYGSVVTAATKRQALDQCLTQLANTHDTNSARAKGLLLTSGRSTDGKKHRSRGRIIVEPTDKTLQRAAAPMAPHGQTKGLVHSRKVPAARYGVQPEQPMTGMPAPLVQNQPVQSNQPVPAQQMGNQPVQQAGQSGAGAGAVAAGGLLPLLAGTQGSQPQTGTGVQDAHAAKVKKPRTSKKAKAGDGSAQQQDVKATQALKEETAVGHELEKREATPKKSRMKGAVASQPKNRAKMTKPERAQAREKALKKLMNKN